MLVPSEKSIVIDNIGRKHTLIKIIASGGEGSVFLTDTNFACKIYKADKIDRQKIEKIDLLIDKKIDIRNVCTPRFKVTFDNYFVGYIMNLVPKCYQIDDVIFSGEKSLLKFFPNWNRKELCKVAINFLTRVKKLHKAGIILGDINPTNILVQDENNVWLIDCDSYQVDKYPCPVGRPEYTRKENHSKKYHEYLRVFDDDIFACYIIVFQILMLGKHPYAYQGGTKPADNMKNPDNFPYKNPDEYAYVKGTYAKSPGGYYMFMYSAMTKKLRMQFYKAFKQYQKVSIEELIDHLWNFVYSIENNIVPCDLVAKGFRDEDGNIVEGTIKFSSKNHRENKKYQNKPYQKSRFNSNSTQANSYNTNLYKKAQQKLINSKKATQTHGSQNIGMTNIKQYTPSNTVTSIKNNQQQDGFEKLINSLQKIITNIFK
ncbi:serine/threonine-protein kinase [Campylobacter sp. RM15925]|uniref:serine/threonine protein kinase n=1 Tax=Campylobacter sp. RM15925 TaxID=1705724 RepID=UPI0014755D66|nr:serine/threonine-protein kinase [Campylobacter sp. RM15925]